jgi:GTPase SAR1 family protein
MNAVASPQECVGCSQPFTFMRTQHMCRSCSLYFCHGCSSSRRAVPEKGHIEPVRVCDVCLHAVDYRARIAAGAKRTVSPTGARSDVPISNLLFVDEATIQQRAAHEDAMNALKRIYKAKIRPLEQAFKFSEFYDSELTDGDFDAKPFVLLIGQYSVGKTSFVQYLLERSDVPGSRVGPEPTTDRFVAVMAGRPGQSDTLVPGNAAAVDLDRPFASLARFGVSFLSKFQVAEVSSPILDMISFVDTPGILSGSKQTMDRGYSFENVVEWFAARSDRILLLFDAHKLDISDELKRVIESLKCHDDKIRVVLNKADMVSSQQLMRVYGALMWSRKLRLQR